MSFSIKTPNGQFTGIRCGLAIQNGVAETDDVETARDLKALGYEVTPDPSPKAKADKKDEK